MSVIINTISDEQVYENYRSLRNTPRQSIAYGVYPNCKKALSEYSALLSALSGDMSDYADLHITMTAQVAPYITGIQQAMQNIVDTVEAIEKSAPGTFGIEVPQDG